MSDSDDKDFLASLVALGVLLFLWPLAILTHAWAFSVVWGWIAVAHFGLISFSVAESAGLVVLARFLVPKPKDEKSIFFLDSLVLLAVGYAVSLFL